jgi:hypothetical protein
MRIMLSVAILVAAGAAVFAVTRGDASRDTASLSNHGGQAIAIRGFRSGTVLGIRDGAALYRIDREHGGPCFAVGTAGDLGVPGSVVCPQGGFPTSGSPVLDLSVYESTRHDVREFSLFRVAGVAADGIAAVEFLRPSGTVALTVPVAGNVYATSDVPKGAIAGFAALDKDGKRVWRSP